MRRGRLAHLAAAAALVLGAASLPARAVLPEEQLDDPILEERARAISRELRCVVCANQSIDDSDAGMARDLRLLVRERLLAGDSDDAVIAHIAERYGDYVRLRPPLKTETLVLWLAPLLLVLGGGGALAVWLWRRRPALVEPDPLTPEERRRVDDLLAEWGSKRDDGAG